MAHLVENCTEDGIGRPRGLSNFWLHWQIFALVGLGEVSLGCQNSGAGYRGEQGGAGGGNRLLSGRTF